MEGLGGITVQSERDLWQWRRCQTSVRGSHQSVTRLPQSSYVNVLRKQWDGAHARLLIVPLGNLSHPKLLSDKQNLLLVLWRCWCIYPIVAWPFPEFLFACVICTKKNSGSFACITLPKCRVHSFCLFTIHGFQRLHRQVLLWKPTSTCQVTQVLRAHSLFKFLFYHVNNIGTTLCF